MRAKLEGKKEGKGKGKTTNYYLPPCESGCGWAAAWASRLQEGGRRTQADKYEYKAWV